MKQPHPYRLLLLSQSRPSADLLRMAEVIGKARNADVNQMAGRDAAALARAITEAPADLLVLEWSRDDAWLAALTDSAYSRHIDAVCVRSQTDIHPRRILVLAGGGPFALEGIHIAGELSAAWNLPVAVLRVLGQGGQVSPRMQEEQTRTVSEQMRVQLSTLRVDAQVILKTDSDVPNAIAAECRESDLIVMGGPATCRVGGEFRNSIPCDIIETRRNPFVIMIPHRRTAIRLNEVFWENTIRINLKANSMLEAITHLVDTLIIEKQVPASFRQKVIDAAVRREMAVSTAFGCQIAIPHAAVPEVHDVIGCMGICPNGIRCCQAGSSANFIFLLLTPRYDYSDYLAVLAQIAGLMQDERNRCALLAAATAAEAASILGKETW